MHKLRFISKRVHQHNRSLVVYGKFGRSLSQLSLKESKSLNVELFLVSAKWNSFFAFLYSLNFSLSEVSCFTLPFKAWMTFSFSPYSFMSGIHLLTSFWPHPLLQMCTAPLYWLLQVSHHWYPKSTFTISWFLSSSWCEISFINLHFSEQPWSLYLISSNSYFRSFLTISLSVSTTTGSIWLSNIRLASFSFSLIC